MRILTWNINGIRTIPQYHPWNTMKTHDDILNLLQADIICFQEMKSSRQNLPKAVGVPPSYHSFFSFPLQKHGYSGVAVYVRSDAVLPRKAEEGLTGLLQPKPPLSAAERVSAEAASDGRALVVDFGLFVLVNTEERLQYKMDFHRMLEARVRVLLRRLERVAAVIDHAEGSLMVVRGQAEGMVGEEGFWARDVRRWLRNWLVSEEEGKRHPRWNTKISARESNYGTRIDYILVTPGLLPWIKAADIQPEIKGSDHCPVFIDLHDQIIDTSGGVIKLRDVLGRTAGCTEPPRVAAKFWDEYKQRLLDTPSSASAPQPPSDPPTPSVTLESEKNDMLMSPKTASAVSPLSELPDDRHSSGSQPLSSIPSSSSVAPAKRKRNAQEPVTSSSKKPKNDEPKPKKAGQTSLASFFSKPAASSSKSKLSEADLLDADYKLALSLSQEPSPPRSSSQSNGESKKAWTTLLAPVKPPLCEVHGEPTKELTVNKPGPNKGKNFFICARPVGPGYDKGKAERLREEVDPAWRCDFFKWSSEVRLEMTRKKSSGGFG
ncbi:Endonuclease/exonuclease/phosphatase [Mycena leptocephala]|nr:Endonuclease/exonuclease/phosphatase [Mycena leptocephala]